AESRFFRAGGGLGGILPIEFLEHREIILFRAGIGRIIAAIPEGQETGMIANPADLVAQGLRGDAVIAILPLIPLLPIIAAAPAGDNQNAFAIAEVQKAIVLGFAFEADGVQVHVLHVTDFLNFAFR